MIVEIDTTEETVWDVIHKAICIIKMMEEAATPSQRVNRARVLATLYILREFVSPLEENV